MTRTTKLAITVLGSLVLLVGGVAAYAAFPTTNGAVSACVLKPGGTIRIIDSATQSCKKGEVALNWNQQGLPGTDGVSGREVVEVSRRGTSPGATAFCPVGKQVISGGGSAQLFTGNAASSAVMLRSRPDIDDLTGDEGWQVVFGKHDGTALDVDEEFSFTIYAICGTVN